MTTHLLVDPEFTAALSAVGLHDFDTFMSRPADGPPASHHRHRETVPIIIPVDGRPTRFFLKRTFVVPRQHIWTDLRRLCRPHGQPWHEWHIIGQLQRAGIPVIRRVAAGERRIAGLPVSGFLLLEAATADLTVWDILSKPNADPSPGDARSLLRELGRLLGRLHRVGLRWPDARPRHVFAERNLPSRGWRLCLIDVERVRPNPGGPVQRAVDLDIWLRRALPYEPSRTEQLAFCSGYRETFGALPVADDQTTSTLSSRARPVRIRAPQAGLPEQFMTREPGDGESRTWLNPHDGALIRAAGIDVAASALESSVGQSLDKPGLAPHRRRQRIELPNGKGSAVYFLKTFLSPPITEQLGRIAMGRGRDSTAWRESHFIRRLTEVGIPTMRCAAVFDRMAGVFERRSALIVAQVPGESLERWLPNAWPTLSRAQRSAMIAQVAAIARVMHRATLFHRDFYLSHLFVSWPRPLAPVIHVIDLARMLERPFRRQRWRIKDLAALHHSTPACVSTFDRLRFLRCYLVCVGATATRLERHRRMIHLIRLIRRRSARMARHDYTRPMSRVTP